MSAEHHRVCAERFVRCDDIPNRVGYRVKFQPAQFFGEYSCPFGFPEWRRRNQSDTNLIPFDLLLISGEKIEAALYPSIAKNLVDGLSHYFTSIETGSDSSVGFVVTNATTRYVPGGTGLRLLSR